MVFSSIPIYLDHHPNWPQLQQLNNQQGNGFENPHLEPSQPPPAHMGGGGGGIKPGSMVDRARLAKLPLPEAGLKCPRCDSTNTKFCYFNNYSLTQPRHFCKTCRRYWTKGGSLRSVPVGGGCRRNKKTKSSSGGAGNSKSVVACEGQMGSNSASESPNCSTEMMSSNQFHYTSTAAQLPIMSALQNLTHYTSSNINTAGTNIGGYHPQLLGTGNSNDTEMGFHMGSSTLASTGGGGDSLRLPFLAGLEPNSGLFPFQTGGETVPSFIAASHEGQVFRSMASAAVTRLQAPVKMEEISEGLNLSRQFLANNQPWGSNSWTEFSGHNTASSTTHLL